MRPAGSALAGLRVLAVEDEALLAMMLQDMLAGLGMVVLGPVASVAKALVLIESDPGPIDLAVLDVDLGTETAYPIGDALAARGLPFVFLTGYGAAAIEDHHRAVPVLTKPVDLAALARMIERITSGQRTGFAAADG